MNPHAPRHPKAATQVTLGLGHYMGPGAAVALFCLSTSCAPQPAQFTTSDKAPDAQAPNTIAPYSPPITELPSPRAALHDTSERFILALESSAPGQLETVLTPFAIVRENSTGSSFPALSGLMEMAAAWGRGHSTRSSGASSPLPPFGPARIIEIRSDGKPTWAAIEVSGPPPVQGTWMIHFDESGARPLIEEVVLPKSR